MTRRLLMAAGGGATVLPPTTFTLTAADDGGWTHASAPRAVEHDGYLYFGYVDMASGNIEVRSMLLTSPYTVSSAFVISAALEVDTHAAPALYVRSDGRLLVVYCEHNATTIYRRVSTNILPDISSFAAAGTVLTGTDLTYPTIVPYGADLHLFYRDIVASTSRLMRTVSSDDGATWSAGSHIYSSASRSSYWMIDGTGSRIDVAASDGRNPPNAGDVTIGHAYYDGSWKKSDGSSAGATPLDPTDLTEVYDSSDGMGWPMDMVSGANPVFVYAVLNDPASNSWRRARWNGSGWDLTVIDESDGDIDTGFASSVCLDHADPDRAYAPVLVGSNWQMFRYRYNAGWTGQQITTGSDDHLTPAPVYGSTGLVRALWMTGGPYTGYLDGGFGLTAGR